MAALWLDRGVYPVWEGNRLQEDTLLQHFTKFQPTNGFTLVKECVPPPLPQKKVQKLKKSQNRH